MRLVQISVGNQQVWDEDLAYVASFNVRGCLMQHDDCQATTAYPYSGQNIAYRVQKKKYLDDKDSVVKMIAQWFDEYENADMSVIDNYSDATDEEYGHFTAVIHEKNGHVGCAMVRFRNGAQYTTIMACNYEYTNMWDEPVYTSGDTCSDCNGDCGDNGLCQQ